MLNNITTNPITTVIGLVIALFTLAGLWFGKIEGVIMVGTLFAISMAFILGKDSIIDKLLGK